MEGVGLNVKVFSHNDLDGVGICILLKKLYNISFNFTFISYNDIYKISEFFNSDEAKTYDFVFITDLNLVEDNFKCVMHTFNKFIDDISNTDEYVRFKKLFIIDHHIDTDYSIKSYINLDYNFIEYTNNLKDCATMQLYRWIIEYQSDYWCTHTQNSKHEDYEVNISWCKQFADLVNDWDIFLWKEKYNFLARNLNILFTHIKREKFIMMQMQKTSNNFALNKTEISIINENLENIKKDYERIIKQMTIKEFNNPFKYTAAIIRCDDNLSLLCDMLKDEFKNTTIDVIVNVSFKYGSINFRRINDDINLVPIANWYGGGGHPFASGCVLNPNNKTLINDFVLPSLKYN